jgi:hypothetical protein
MVVSALGPPCFLRINVTVAGQGDSAEQGVDEGGGLERRQIVGSFTKPDQLHQQAGFLLDAENDAALGRSVQLCQYRADDVHCVGSSVG